MLQKAAHDCAALASGITSLAVKLDPDDGSAPPNVSIADGAATPELRQCVIDALGHATFPKPPDHLTIHAPAELHF